MLACVWVCVCVCVCTMIAYLLVCECVWCLLFYLCVSVCDACLCVSVFVWCLLIYLCAMFCLHDIVLILSSILFVCLLWRVLYWWLTYRYLCPCMLGVGEAVAPAGGARNVSGHGSVTQILLFIVQSLNDSIILFTGRWCKDSLWCRYSKTGYILCYDIMSRSVHKRLPLLFIINMLAFKYNNNII